jgi:hypothetical protein
VSLKTFQEHHSSALDIGLSAVQQKAAAYYWRLAEQWTDCSGKCQGSQKQRLGCVDAVNGRMVQEQLCTAQRPDIGQRMCNLDCFYK